MKLGLARTLLDLKARKQQVALVTELATGAQDLYYDANPAPALNLSAAARDRVAALVAADRSEEVALDGRNCFVQVHNPTPRLIIVGAVHISQALAPMAARAGYEVTVVDPRRSFATDERFPGVTLDGAWPDEAMEKLKPDIRTAVVTLTHDPKLDDPALSAALRSPAFYIGALGSKKTHAARVGRLTRAGFGESDIARIHGPAGLDIGAKSPAEIAVSVLAQLTAARRGRQSQRANPG
ncbi:MAG TPA: XdhC family protein [Dongiaceae bacterium]|jgi:xanthine dehydrogenase accessory factor|nr:XdhC family protein [Dongiaceae bacterium]